MLGILDGITLELKYVTGYYEDDNISFILSLGTYDTLGFAVFYETKYGIFLEEVTNDTLGIIRVCGAGIHIWV